MGWSPRMNTEDGNFGRGWPLVMLLATVNGARTRREMAGRSEEIDARFVSDDEHKDGPGIRQTAHASYRRNS